MGRCLNFSITKENGGFSTKEKQTILDISNKFNSGPFKDVWTCENFYLDPFNYYPNWDDIRLKDGGAGDGWDVVNKRHEELMKTGIGQIRTVKTLHKEKLIKFHRDPDGNEISGFCKVQGNEFNALLIYQALIELSKLIKHSVVKLSDEGRFLYCNVKIKNGKAQPDFTDIQDSIRCYCNRLVMNASEPYLAQINKLALPKGILNDLHIDGSPYPVDMCIEHINEKLFDLNEVYQILKPHIETNYHCFSNIENQWFKPELLCRPVKKEDFDQTECNPGTLMAGFYGEYWKLSDKDAEKESYKTIASMQKMLGGDLQMDILGEKKDKTA